jgi:RNA polymerase sigma-70 factor (ECF subfamily)
VDVHEAPERADGGLTRGEIRRAIYDAMDGLTSDLRDAFLLRDIEERSYAEIATLLEASESAIRQRVKRARDHMRRALEEFA